jgi:enamine deaminase RidA (YjgF/YER057c/UK114 family)
MKSLARNGRNRPFSPYRQMLLAIFGTVALAAAPANAEISRIKGNANALILDGVRISGDLETFYLSGQLPSPVDPKKPMTEVKSIEEMGDTKAQTISTLQKIKTLLESQGYKMSDLVKLQLFIAADPRTGKMDFAGANDGFKQFFGTADNPNTVARSTFQVAALVGPYFLIEIEAVAVKPKGTALNGQPAVAEDAEKAADAGQPANEATAAYNRPHRYPKALRKKASMA